MAKIEIFESEINDGLADKIAANAEAGIKFNKKINPDSLRVQKPDSLINFLARASLVDDPTLYPIDSILCSIGWNENDDVFLPEETFKARNSIIDKPVNFNHVATDIIGHIKASILVDKDYNPLPSNIEAKDLPEKWHIATAAVIYKAWEDEERQKAIAKVIEEIEDDEWFVSMECFFGGFDYALVNKKTSENYVIARNKETAFLTKRLRIYGGAGQYDGYTIGRVLRKITFNGKGLVKNPGNKESIIFSESSPFTSAKNINSVYDIVVTNTNKENMMPESNELLAELKVAKASLEAKVTELQTQLSEVNQNASKASLAKLEAEVTAKDEQIKTLTEQVNGLEVVKAEMNKTIQEVTAKANEAEAKLATIAAEQLKSTRISALVEAGLKKEEAVAKAEKFMGLNDEMFGEIVALAKSSVKPTEAPKEETQPDAGAAAAAALAGAKPTEEEVPTGGAIPNVNEEKMAAQAALAEYLGVSLAQYNKNSKKTEKK